MILALRVLIKFVVDVASNIVPIGSSIINTALGPETLNYKTRDAQQK
jgi:hypothetical protein